jgi:hypothetical protein
MNDETSKVFHPTIEQRDVGTVFCPLLPIRFPTVYRIVQSMTRAQLDERRLYHVEPFVFNHYTLTEEDDDARRYPGTIERKAIRTLDPAVDCVSLVIRHHRSPEQASGYLTGLDDFSVDCGDEPICRTEEGIFTLITRPTNLVWPGPLIIYCVDKVPADDCLGEDNWQVAIAPGGTLIERFADFRDLKEQA